MSKVIFNMPTKIKLAAARRAEREGLTLTTVLAQAAYAYSQGTISITIAETPRLRPEVLKELLKASADSKKGKNSVGPFTEKEAATYLRKLMR
jgi:hypothetical protein